jgi:hypothetical protein
MSLAAQRELDTFAYRTVVFDQQDTWHAHKYPYADGSWWTITRTCRFGQAVTVP